MFAYGTNEFEGQGCQDGVCKCHCINIKDDLDASCQELDEENYWFFKYKPDANFAMDGMLL